jgi:ABC-type spermidine/putrescine transport system permease subunit II
MQGINPRLTIWPQEFTLKWYQIKAGGLGESLLVSISISVPAVIFGVLISLPLGFALSRYNFRGKELIKLLMVAPIVIPGVVLGFAYLQLFNTGVFNSIPTIMSMIIAHIVIVIPYTSRPILAGYQGIDLALEEASSTLGARSLTTFIRITFPLLTTSILAGAILGFARSVNDFIITLFLIKPGFVPLSVQVYQTTQFGIPQITSALGTILLLFSLTFATIAEYILRQEIEL